jgi:transposase
MQNLSRFRDQIAALYWERNGFCQWHKRLEKSFFHWPRKNRPPMLMKR